MGEADRLGALEQLGLLGTPAEERFDRITRLAKRMFHVRSAAIDLVGKSHAWFKSLQGPGREHATPREGTCCNRVITEDATIVVLDTRGDPRFATLPLPEDLRFYAGVPLHSCGQAVGTLCIFDPLPRAALDEGELAALEDLARLAEDEFESEQLSASQLLLAAENKSLTERALVDPLTHLWNRGAIFEVLDREIVEARRGKRSLGAIMFDIDHFKRVNDEHGHTAGDAVLRAIADRARSAVRPYDAIGRYGGEEFLAVLPSSGIDEAFDVAERVRLQIARRPIPCDGAVVPVTASFGIAVLENGLDGAALVERADRALYRSKSQGRNCTTRSA